MIRGGLESSVEPRFMKLDVSAPAEGARRTLGQHGDVCIMFIHTKHSLYSQYGLSADFARPARVSAIATPALLAKAARDHAAHTTARISARAHRGCSKSPPGSHLAARNPHIRGLVAASSPRGACTRS